MQFAELRRLVLIIKEAEAFSKGLEDIVAAESSICQIDGKNSKLFYRGYDIHDLAQNSTFEETAYLLLFGNLPTERQLVDFSNKLASERELPKGLVQFIQAFPKTVNPMAALRTGVSLLSFFDPEAEHKSVESKVPKAIRLPSREIEWHPPQAPLVGKIRVDPREPRALSWTPFVSVEKK